MTTNTRDSLLTRLSDLIEQRIGLTRGIFGAVLGSVVDSVAGADVLGFIHTLKETPETGKQWQTLLKALMIGETYFFRHRAQLNWLDDIILPELLEDHQQNITMWSAGCASGEEVYSLAIAIHEAVQAAQRHSIQIIGTDINQSALDAARRGRYRSWSFRENTDLFRHTYFDEVDGELQLRPFIKNMVSLSQRNLLSGAPHTPLDVIMCCNVLLYFTEESASRVENLFFDALRPGGWLLLGQAEALRFGRARWQTHLFPGGAAYQKPRAQSNLPRVAIYHEIPPRLSAQIVKEAAAEANDYPEILHALRLKQYDKAETLVQGILRTSPNDDRAHVIAGHILANRDQAADAHTALDTALRLNSLNGDAHYLKGVLFLEAVAIGQAIESFRSALYCQPGHPLASIILGNLYLQTNEREKARRVWSSALETLRSQPAENLVSDLSDMTVGSMVNFFLAQINP
ncbi:MAG: CheR family methyltransferase [Anaerolineae bacterium]